MREGLIRVSVLAALAAVALLGAKPRPPKPPPAPPATRAPAPSAPSAPLRREPFLPAPIAPATLPGHDGETKCGLCHSPAGWIPARFAHDQTGFPLKGAHASTACKGCHVGAFTVPLARGCAGCHRDAHKGDLGQRCEGCHDEQSWKTGFTIEAHQRTNFPLSGRHAFIPCVECHPQARDRQFTRSATDCYGCHAADYTRTAVTSLDHAALGFSTQCRECHNPWRFKGARFPAHDQCFQIGVGKHANISCAGCHSTVPKTAVTGACASGTAACTSCHDHTCARSDAKHAEENVAGYQCKDRKCYECHRFSGQ